MSEHHNQDLTPEERQLQAAVRRLGEVQADDAFREKLRRQFVSGEMADDASAPDAAVAPVVIPSRPARPRRRLALLTIPAVAVALAASLAVIFLGGGSPAWQLLHVRGEGAVLVNGVAAEAGDERALAGLIMAEARVVVPEGVEVDIILDQVMVLGVAGPADFTVPASPAKGPYRYEATVNAGEFRIKTGPDFPGREVGLLTAEGRVEITGTTVAVFKNADLTCVCVLEGTAHIGRDGAHLDAVPAGMRMVMFADGRDPLVVPIEPGHRQSLLDFEAYNRNTFR